MHPPPGEQVSPKCLCLCMKTTSCYTQEVHIVKLIAMIISDLTYLLHILHSRHSLVGFFSGRVYSQNIGEIIPGKSSFPILFCRSMTYDVVD